MKKIIALISVLLLVVITACAEDEVTPQERFDQYVKHWNKKEFSEMYKMVTTNSEKEYPTEEFVDRYKNIYGDLNVENLKVTYKKLSAEDIETAMEKGTAQFPFQVKMETIAGPINFDYEATLIQEGEEENKNWFVKWDPGFIFPQIKDGGKIRIDTEAPKRGEILDRNRMPLAINDKVPEIGVVPERLQPNPEEQKQKIADLLGMSVEEINNALNAGWVKPNLYVPLAKVPKNDEETLSQLAGINGVSQRAVTGRVYPNGEATGHLVGYIGKITAEELEKQEPGTYGPNDIIGKRGMEQLFEDRLKGTQGVAITVEKEGQDPVVLAEKRVEHGENIITTIDAELQKQIYATYDGDAGTTAAIHPKTGETLALVSSPSFDPNQFLFGISQSEWDKLQNDPQQPLVNRFTATYAPGSTIKPVTAAIGLGNGTIKPGEGMEINGLTWSGGEGWGNYEVRRVSESNGPVDVTNALIRSDNIFFARKAVEMGVEKYSSGLKKFGFSKEFPYTYPIETSTISNSGSLDDEVLLADTSYGQGELQMSALHLASTFTPFLNDGNLLKPVLLADEEKSQVWQEQLISTEQAKVVREALRKVVSSPIGTAKGAQKADFPISGKTGTAELKKAGEESGAENGWFVAYPSDSQDILLAMMVESTEDRGGSAYTIDKVTEVLSAYKN
ncbi:penicillin-binding transpeptidase domain-containing protein [Virgibacillus kekensis]|uniref:serine-type D-Ala-D-Ala carboxypeptidase n=1 Tax=Virgibacillus kekensis TaxID=202261 RepID=A0ABV9DGJ3_9BACI